MDNLAFCSRKKKKREQQRKGKDVSNPMEGGCDQVCTSSTCDNIEWTRHSQWFAYLFRRGFPGSSSSFHSQRLLLMFFTITSGDILNAPWLNSETSRDDVEHELQLCYNRSNGGFQPEPVGLFVGEATLTLTHCALQILHTIGRFDNAVRDWLDVEQTTQFVQRCQVGADSHLVNSEWAGGFAAYIGSLEVDVRFSYSALMTLQLLRPTVPLAAAMGECDDPHCLGQCLRNALQFVLKCWCPLEGAFSGVPQSGEAHGGMTFCAVASLVLLRYFASTSRGATELKRRCMGYCVHRLNCGPSHPSDCDDEAALHFQGREANCHGFQGRTNKFHDVCYTFWIGATLRMLELLGSGHAELECAETRFTCTVLGDGEQGGDKGEWSASLVDLGSIFRFVLSCGGEHGGFGKDDGDDVDPLHSCLGLAGLGSLLYARHGHNALSSIPTSCTGLCVHPVYCCTEKTALRQGFPVVV